MKKADRVLEIGCGTGRNLHELVRRTGCTAIGIDPSAEATREGTRLFPGITLSVGTADSLPLPDADVDFVYFGFCLYLIDRPLLTKVVAEADRVLKDKGFLAITDFDNPIRLKVPYKHREGVHTYKADYSACFTAFHYTLVDRVSFSHATDGFSLSANDRICHSVLHKDLEGAYSGIP